MSFKSSSIWPAVTTITLSFWEIKSIPLGIINLPFLIIAATNTLCLIFKSFKHLFNTLLFLFVSIPLAEGHQKERKEGFDLYKSETRMLLPIKKPLF